MGLLDAALMDTVTSRLVLPLSPSVTVASKMLKVGVLGAGVVALSLSMMLMLAVPSAMVAPTAPLNVTEKLSVLSLMVSPNTAMAMVPLVDPAAIERVPWVAV